MDQKKLGYMNPTFKAFILALLVLSPFCSFGQPESKTISLGVNHLRFKISDSIHFYCKDKLLGSYPLSQTFNININESDSLIFLEEKCLNYDLSPADYYRYQRYCNSNRMISLIYLGASHFIFNDFHPSENCSNFPIRYTSAPFLDSFSSEGYILYPGESPGESRSCIIDISTNKNLLLNSHQFLQVIEDIVIGYNRTEQIIYDSYETLTTFTTYQFEAGILTVCYSDTLKVEKYGYEFQLRDAHLCSKRIEETKKLSKFTYAFKLDQGWNVYQSSNSENLLPPSHTLIASEIDSVYAIPFFNGCFVVKEGESYQLWIHEENGFQKYVSNKIELRSYLTPGIGRPDKNLLIITLDRNQNFIIDHYRGRVFTPYIKYTVVKSKSPLKEINETHYSLNKKPIRTLIFENVTNKNNK
ncbi:hypothetical protein SAMN05216474_0342 [Lishizhenia tianjinensis]|uniref:Uncharacterized protein n=1 Tax=Lishizhenia tianjinensis TaxID=477690 RepID=A0A1I6XP88_9FLAO|nr:hypothetical protein [Lishizhenia tianjinensis]SFT39897.1 hypothetical protein SAMN05216474_0342 [Lishizhenia tianjinensis]